MIKNLKLAVRTNEAIPYDLLLLADPSMDRINGYLDQSKMILAKDKAEVVGILVLSRLNAGEAEIMNIATEPSLQGRGIGTRLIHEAIKMSKSLEYSKLHIGTADTSLDQMRFYQNVGFTVTGKIHNFFIEHYEKPIYENGKQALDMIRLEMSLT